MVANNNSAPFFLRIGNIIARQSTPIEFHLNLYVCARACVYVREREWFGGYVWLKG